MKKTANTYIGVAANYSKVDGTVDFGSSYTLPNITNPGYNLVGWYKDAACTVPASSGCNTIGDHTIYSKWETAAFKVTFNANGGTCSTASKNVTFNDNFGDLPTPSPRTGFVFKGWYDSITGGNRITESTVLTDATDKTL